MLRVLGICGSLRKGSYNALLLRAYAEWAPPDTTIETAHIEEIPSYNEDVRQVGLSPRRRPAFPPVINQRPPTRYGTATKRRA